MIGAVLLAAGRATRFGGAKLLADLAGKPLVAHIVEAIRRAGLPSPIAVVADPEIRYLMDSLGVRSIPPSPGNATLGRSLAAAALTAPVSWDGMLVCLGDMPLVRPASFAAIACHVTRETIVRPTHAGRPGNPVAWGRIFFAELASLSEDRGGRDLMSNHRSALVELDLDDPGILQDVDTIEDLEAVRDRLRTSP